MRSRQSGLASIVVVMVLTVLITLISLAFARLMDRAANDSQQRQASSVATYSAQSAINDLSTYIKDNPTAYSQNCTGNNSLIGSSSNPGPFYNDANLSGDSSRTSQYSCLLLNQTPVDLVYQQLPSNKSRVIKMTTSASPGALDKIMLSWQPTDAQITGYPPSGNSLLDKSTWNDASHNYVPMLRVTLYPVPVGGSIANVQAKSKTVFLYPAKASGPVPSQSYSSLADGSLLPVGCTNSLDASSFNGTADYTCNLIISNLTTSTLPDQIDYFYVRLMPIYNNLNVKIKANDQWSQSLNFVKVQAVLDATAKSGNVAKRLQARVDISSTNPAQPGENIAPASDAMPEYAVRSAGAICKRLVGVNSYYNYTQIDGPPALCNQSIISTPPPGLKFTIDSIDSESRDPYGQNGTSYIGSSTLLAWRSTDSPNYCNASASPPMGEWSGDKNPASSWDPVARAGSGSQTIASIGSVTRFSLQCSGPGGPPITKTVTAWPPPTATITAPDSVEAGSPYPVSWTANNASRCDFSGDWPDKSTVWNPSGAPQPGTSSTVYTRWNDPNPNSFTITCYNPNSRLFTVTKTVTHTPPYSLCSARTQIYDKGDGTGWATWNGACPAFDPSLGKYYATGNVVNGDVASAGGPIQLDHPGRWCLNLKAGADPWGWLAYSQPDPYCADIIAPTFTFTPDSSTVGYNESTTLRWTTSHVTWCSASDGWSGSQNPAGGTFTTGRLKSSQTYTLQCGGTGVSAAPQTIRISVTPPAPPTASVSVSRATINEGENSTISWSSSGFVDRCNLGGQWAGYSTATSGSRSDTLNSPGTYTYTATCSGPGGTSSLASATVTVNSNSPGPSPGPPRTPSPPECWIYPVGHDNRAGLATGRGNCDSTTVRFQFVFTFSYRDFHNNFCYKEGPIWLGVNSTDAVHFDNAAWGITADVTLYGWNKYDERGEKSIRTSWNIPSRRGASC